MSQEDLDRIRELQGELGPKDATKRFSASLVEVTHSFTGMLIGALLVTGKFYKMKPYWRLDNEKPFFRQDYKTKAYRIVHNLYRVILVGGLVAATIWFTK